jgi:hypothetical protein
MILDDFVMLGTTVPEPNSDGRVFVCSAGVSPEYGKLVRIYPLARRGIPKRWGVYRVPLERNSQDSRDESFKVAGDRTPGAHERINERFETVRKEFAPAKRADLLAPYVVGSIKEANARSKGARTPRERFSLAIIHPEAIDLTFDINPASPDASQLVLFDTGDTETSGAKRFPAMPRLHFKDELGWNHQMLRDWGAFELQRKHGEDYFRRNLADALHLRPDSSLLVGNFNQHRGSWLVISVLNGIREAPTLFDALASDRPAIPGKLRQQVYERDEWRCCSCGSTVDLDVDHIWPRSRGGGIALENLQTLCKPCNLSKSDRTDGAA